MKVLKRGLYAQVLAVRPGSPAATAGIQPGDVIRKIDGESVGALSAWALERRLRGAEGSEVVLLRYAAATSNLGKVTLRRALPAQPALEVRREEKLTLVALPDLGAGRSDELKVLLAGLDHAKPLVLDLRNCMGGDLAEAARAAGLFVGAAVPLVTVQEPGAKEGEVQESPVAAQPAGQPAFSRVAVLLGPSAFGAPEALAAGLKKAGIEVFGERSSGLGVERTRINLRQGGAVELVTKRWLGAGGEKLDRAGVEPTTALKGLKPGEDPLPKLLPLLEAKPAEKGDKAPAKAASLRPGTARTPAVPEVA
jgi:carboxyl-terminal processing protease